jgi:glycosyltransferase involved in cell wall biosynthesis
MKRAILISCYYPPDGGVGVQRVMQLVKQAPRCGWDLTVVTRHPPSKRTTWEPVDETLAKDEGGRVIRVPMGEGSRAGDMVPGPAGADDPFLSGVIEAVTQQLKQKPTDAVILTMPPYGMSPVVPAIRKVSDVPIFVDLRDPWALDGACSYSNKAHWSANHQWMQDVLSVADGVIANTPEAGIQLSKAVPGLNADNVAVVNNGCTVSAFQGPMPPRPEAMEASGIQIVHTGTLHSNAFERTRGMVGRLRKLKNYRVENISISGRTAHHLLRAMTILTREQPELMSDVRLNLVGVDDPSTKRIVENSPCRDRVRLTGFVPYQESVAWMRHADALFVPLFGLPKGHRSRIIPYKTYEYLASGRPILGALPEGDARDLVEKSGRGHCADPCDDRAIAKALVAVIAQAKQIGRDTPPVEPFVHDYDWDRQCERFFDFLNQQIEPAASSQAG